MTEFTSKYAATKHGDVIVCATTACFHARLRTAPIPSRERQRADAQLLMTFCLSLVLLAASTGWFFGDRSARLHTHFNPRSSAFIHGH